MKNDKLENANKPTLPIKNKKNFPWGNIGIILSALSFIVLITGIYLGLCRLLHVNKGVGQTLAQLESQASQQQADIAALQKTANEAQQNLQAWSQQFATQKQIINELRTAQQGNKEAWSVAEAQYLVKLANDNLQISDNIPLIINLLQTADQKLQESSDPKLLPVRQGLANDIAALQGTAVVDTSGIYLRLLALNNEIDNLPLPNNRPIGQTETNVTETKMPWWKHGWQQSLNVLSKIVIVRYNQSDAPAFVSPDLQNYLYQNLHAQLEQAMFAAIRKQPEIYRASLEQAESWIKKYFLQDSPITQSALKTISELRALNIRPALPTLTLSLEAFREYFMSPGNAATPAPPPATADKL